MSEDPSDAARLALAKREQKIKTPFSVQAKALFRKNLIQQRRAVCANLFIVFIPLFFVGLLAILQHLINVATDKPSFHCGCLCLSCCTSTDPKTQTCRSTTPGNPCQVWEICQQYDTTKCGIQYSTAQQAPYCPVPSPAIWPAFYTVPSPGFLAHPWSPKAAMLMTAKDPVLADTLQLFPDPSGANQAASLSFFQEGQATNSVYAGAVSLLGAQIGTYQQFPNLNFYIEPALIPDPPDYNGSMYLLVTNASSSAVQATIAAIMAGFSSATATGRTPSVNPLEVQQVWKSSAEDINNQLYCGYKESRCNGTSDINAITNAWDFGDSNPSTGSFSTLVWYNVTGRYSNGGQQPTQLVRIHAAINSASDALLRAGIKATNALLRLAGIMEMPKPPTRLSLDIASLVGTLFYTWLLQLQLPVMVATLVSEKEGRLRTMMKMHGLGDTAYWLIMYTWYFAFNLLYTWILIGEGSATGLSFFTRTNYSFQFVFYLLWVACLVSFAFLLSVAFRSARTAIVVTFLYVFGSGLIGYLLLQSFVGAGDWWAVFFDIVPGFALYRGLYEIAQYAFIAAYQGTQGITWGKLNDPNNGLPAVMIFFAVEAIVFLVLAWYLEQVLPGSVGVARHPLFFLGKKYKSDGGHGNGNATVAPAEKADVAVAVEPEDVAGERQRVEGILRNSGEDGPQRADAAVVVSGLTKWFPGRRKKVIVRDLALAVARGECFGLLGPNGAGKSTTINILTGFLTPSSGTAWVNGHDIRSDMDAVYGQMGVCPQDNLIWPQLSAREHLSFYGRLKNLTGNELDRAVEAALKSVNLWNGRVGDKQAKNYSGGMKRRLSVAISLIGDPLVVYMDEPSTGLDPASRQNLWEAVKAAKPGRGIILTTHSMEEASVLCDRLGIFVDGQLVCIGNPKELTARHGGYYVFTVTTPPDQEMQADALVRRVVPSARLTYALAGTRRYELPVEEVTLAAVFETMEKAVSAGGVKVLDWGVANATLEEVFIKFAKSIGAEGGN